MCKICPDRKECVTEKKYVAKRIECTINYGVYNKCAAVMQKEGAKEKSAAAAKASRRAFWPCGTVSQPPAAISDFPANSSRKVCSCAP